MTNEELTARLKEVFKGFNNESGTFERGCLSRMSFVSCSADDRTLSMDFTLDERDLNTIGMIHGGVMSLLMDLIMGLLVVPFANGGPPTVELDVSFFRPVRLGESMRLTSHITHLGRTFIHTNAEAVIIGSEKLAATGKGIYLASNWGNVMSREGYKL